MYTGSGCGSALLTFNFPPNKTWSATGCKDRADDGVARTPERAVIASTGFGSSDEGSLQAVQQDVQTPEKSTMAQAAATETPEKPSEGRKHGQKDYSFEERLRLLDWAIDSSIIARPEIVISGWTRILVAHGLSTFHGNRSSLMSVWTLFWIGQGPQTYSSGERWSRRCPSSIGAKGQGSPTDGGKSWVLECRALVSRRCSPNILTYYLLLNLLMNCTRESVISKNQPLPNPSTKHFRQRWGFVAVKVIVCQQSSADPGSNFGWKTWKLQKCCTPVWRPIQFPRRMTSPISRAFRKNSTRSGICGCSSHGTSSVACLTNLQLRLCCIVQNLLYLVSMLKQSCYHQLAKTSSLSCVLFHESNSSQ